MARITRLDSATKAVVASRERDMKVYGFEVGQDERMELSEISLVASSGELRKLARFLSDVATKMEIHGRDFGHEHFRDHPELSRDVSGSTDVIVAQEKS